MAQLSDTQLIILSAAAQRDDRIALPLPPNLKGGAATKVVSTMIAKGLLEEVEARRIAFQPHLSDPVWRETGDGHGVTLVITDVGLAAIGIEPDEVPEPDAPRSATLGDTGASAGGADHDATPTNSASTVPAGAKARTRREGTKQATLIAMLRAPEGATIAEIVAVTGWQPHTVRGAMAGALKKKLDLEVTSDKIEGRGRVYRLPPV
ncbi:DUF3489 domain-containing protein [Shinella sp. PSBB067]|uniref:DUF3489 domain-containing protein n=1 Tax=Shinella sp. PSBB067 TaxID=2715959 RepID=UPI00193C043B|nr:DUF3489 domain-containing protein [Shinella sp. PSBB067]QRI64531.1 DUF3489 domain-containing protein [Shinella sp. PSBB067]